jgi:hypothetical protein
MPSPVVFLVTPWLFGVARRPFLFYKLFLNLPPMRAKAAGQKSDAHEEHDTRISVAINCNPMQKI